MSKSSALNDIITRTYNNFRGVDFTGGIVANYRSPDALNMWKDYKDDDCVQTRPGMNLLGKFDNAIYGLFFYRVNDTIHALVHSGTKLYEWDNYPNNPVETTVLYQGLNPSNSRAFVYDGTFFFMDGINYLEYNGETLKEVEGTIPITSYYKNPDGSTNIDLDTDTDLVYQAVNVLQPKRINHFIADGTSVNFQLDATELDSATTYVMVAKIGNTEYVENQGFTVNRTTGVVTFSSAPAEGAIVTITYSKTVSRYRNRILNCSMIAEFDNRIFFSGNPDFPNAVFHCELNDPRYIRDTAYYECGVDIAPIKAIIPGNNVLWVVKEIYQNQASLFYMTPTIDEKYAKIYPVTTGNVAVGCDSTGINFNDDIVYFSNRGLEGVTSNSMYSEQILQHRSSLIDTKLLTETNYTNIKLAEYEGYLVCLVNVSGGSHVYLADSRKKFQNVNNDIEYEWYYWELPYEISMLKEYRGTLYLGDPTGQIFELSGTKDVNSDIASYWTTREDDFGYPAYTKTTNKRGNVADLKTMDNDNILISTIVDGTTKIKKTSSDEKSYLAYRIKDKKFKKIQLKFSSNKPFGIFSCTLQGFIAGYIKR